MSEFRARLRKPKPELWLGCVISAANLIRSPSGRWMVTVHYANCPFISHVSAEFIERVRRDLKMSGCGDVMPLIIGERVNVNVEWQDLPGKRFAASARICWKSYYLTHGIEVRNV